MGSALLTTYNGENVLEVKNSSIFRQLPTQCDGWSKLRIGVRFKIRCSHMVSGDIALRGPRFFIGLSHGDSFGFNDRTETEHCFGVWSLADAFSWAIYEGSGVPAWFLGYWYTAKKVGATVTTGASYHNTLVTIPTDAGTMMGTVLIEIIKAAPNMTAITLGRLHSSANRTTPSKKFETAGVSFKNVQGLGKLYDTGLWSSGAADTTIAVDEANDGVLDHFHLSWCHEHSSLLISDIFVRKFV